jgi:phosphopentomutase
MLVAPHDVSRVIARPFVGSPGSFSRTKNRRDYSIQPPEETLLDALAAAGVPRSGVGKVDDLFAGRAISSRHTADNADGIRALLEFDAALPRFEASLREDDLLFITADHGNDPTTPSTDHARECVPLLVLGSTVRPGSVGRRSTFSDLGATIAEWFGIAFRGRGTSFLSQVVSA